MEIWAVILAAGSGSRLAEACGQPKQFLEWRGRPLYWHSVIAMSRIPGIVGISLILPRDRVDAERQRILDLFRQDDLGVEIRIKAGGATRQESSAIGIASVASGCTHVLIHDAARCFVTPELIQRVCAELASGCKAVAPGLPVTDTIKLMDAGDLAKVESTLPRERLYAMQTPQGFEIAALREAIAKIGETTVTDDLALLEKAGIECRIVKGDPANIKITNPEDLERLRPEAKTRSFRTGFGYDVHRYGDGRPLKIGGVEIGGKFQVIAHSDGDVLLHSLMDALLGCACLGDIGQHFPDSDPAWEGVSSAVLLDHVLGLLIEKGMRVEHVDLTVVAQKPKLAPFADQIRKNVARLLQIPATNVNFKATTEEGLGFTGRLEGIKACATATVSTD